MTLPKPPKVKESAVLAACMGWLRVQGLDPIRNNSGSLTQEYKSKGGGISRYRVRFGKPGAGDIVCCTKHGTWLEIECKSTYGIQEPKQIERQKYVESLGGIYILARSLDDITARKGEIV